MKNFELVELFAGIGGFRIAFDNAVDILNSKYIKDTENVVNLSRVTSIDTSGTVLKCYKHNFPSAVSRKRKRQGKINNSKETIIQANIEYFKNEELDNLGNVWTMSPPCQPFTTTDQAKQLGAEDKRNKAFSHLMKVLSSIANPPKLIFFENVKGFKDSEVHKSWISCLQNLGYDYQHFLLSPLSFGIPMNRTRFYVVAVHKSIGSRFQTVPEVQTVLNLENFVDDFQSAQALLNKRFIFDFNSGNKWLTQNTIEKECGGDVILEETISGPTTALPLSYFVDKQKDKDTSLLLSDDLLQKPFAPGLSFVGEDDRATFCFTSAYGHKIHKSSGSFYHCEIPRGKNVDKSVQTIFKSNAKKVRMFSPMELLRLFGFPPSYQLPKTDESFLRKHQYKVVGQGISITVVQHLVLYVLLHIVGIKNKT